MATPEELVRFHTRIAVLIVYGPRSKEDIILYDAMIDESVSLDTLWLTYKTIMYPTTDVYAESKTQ